MWPGGCTVYLTLSLPILAPLPQIDPECPKWAEVDRMGPIGAPRVSQRLPRALLRGNALSCGNARKTNMNSHHQMGRCSDRDVQKPYIVKRQVLEVGWGPIGSALGPAAAASSPSPTPLPTPSESPSPAPTPSPSPSRICMRPCRHVLQVPALRMCGDRRGIIFGGMRVMLVIPMAIIDAHVGSA